MKALQPKKNSSLKIKDTYISIKVELHKYLKLNSELQKNGIIVSKELNQKIISKYKEFVLFTI